MNNLMSQCTAQIRLTAPKRAKPIRSSSLMRRAGVSCLALMVVGCAMNPPAPIEPWESEEADAAFECVGAAQCSTAWRAAQAWVVANSGYKIQVVSDAIIQTYNATNYSTSWAFTVTREPRGGDVERFFIVPSCGQAPLCRMVSWRMSARFNRAMRQVTKN